MKKILFFMLMTGRACAQWIVNDPVNTAVNAAVQAGQAANHLEVMRQWAQEIEQLNRQVRQLEAALAVQQRIRDVMGDPSAAGAGLVLHDLGATDLARTYGESLAATQRLANAVDSLRRTSEGLYQRLEDRTALGGEFVRQEPLYRRYAAVERQADNLAAVQAETEVRAAALQADVAVTLARLRTAATQAETDKLAIQLTALNGQLARVEAQRQTEAGKLTAQQILNENQAAKERQDLLERQAAEERQSLGVIGEWQERITITATDYTRP